MSHEAAEGIAFAVFASAGMSLCWMYGNVINQEAECELSYRVLYRFLVLKYYCLIRVVEIHVCHLRKLWLLFYSRGINKSISKTHANKIIVMCPIIKEYGSTLTTIKRKVGGWHGYVVGTIKQIIKKKNRERKTKVRKSDKNEQKIMEENIKKHLRLSQKEQPLSTWAGHSLPPVSQ